MHIWLEEKESGRGDVCEPSNGLLRINNAEPWKGWEQIHTIRTLQWSAVKQNKSTKSFELTMGRIIMNILLRKVSFFLWIQIVGREKGFPGAEEGVGQQVGADQS